ncbi:MAG TPA: O-antigen polysaccharide polymerase Wzy [Alphaproteobacteria bacterium]|jgi:hypothetical protein
MIETALYVHLGIFVAIAACFALSRNASLFHPLAFYLLFHAIVFVIRPFMVYYLKFDGRWVYMRFFPTDSQFVFTLVVTSVALLVFAAACWFGGRAQTNFADARLPEFTSVQKQAFFWTAALLGPLTIYSTFFAAQDVGYDDKTAAIQMTVDLATGNTIYVNTTGYIVEAQTMIGSFVLLFMWRFRFALWTWVPLILFVGYRAFLGGGRWPMITTIFTLVLMQLFNTRKRWFRIRYLVIFVPIFILFQNVGLNRNYFRDYIGSEKPVAEFRDDRTWLEKQDNPDFANFEFLTYILWAVPELSKTYTYFTQYLQIFTEPIPRILWKDKPTGSPITLINLNDYGNFVGLTASLPGDGWLSFGWAGLVFTMGMVGLFLGWLHKWFWRNLHEPAKVLIYCVFLPLTVQWFRDGGISIAKFSLFTILPVALWLGLTRFLEWLRQYRATQQVRILPRRR